MMKSKLREIRQHPSINVGTKGPWLIFVPGFAVKLRDLEDIILPLSKHYRVISFEFPQVADIKKYPTITIEHYFELLTGLMEKHQLKKVSLVGQSLGATIALAYAGQFPQKVEKVVALCAFVKGRSRNPVVLYGISIWNVMQRIISEKKLEPLFDVLKNLINWRRSMKLMRFMHSLKPEVFLPKMKAPTMFVVGGRDVVSLPETQRALARSLPNSQLEYYPNYGHTVIHLQRDDIVRKIRRFIGK
jgi:pimeloyl-ACP methyl ester carboxylesterase